MTCKSQPHKCCISRLICRNYDSERTSHNAIRRERCVEFQTRSVESVNPLQLVGLVMVKTSTFSKHGRSYDP
ncbi:hypothetical protein LeptoLang_05470 [Leptospira interrogans serovar Icterohaemorrhagiae]|nr:hypothetical protein LeptoLang_05470 [Leptospira interrogans serovar Icterohaemorrhagiae]